MPLLTQPVVPRGTLAAMRQPELHAGGLTLRAWRRDDVPALVDAYSDAAIQQWNLRTMTAVEAVDWIETQHRNWAAESDAGWAVVYDASKVLAGRVGLRHLSLSEGQGEITYWVLPQARGQGIAVTATLAVSEWAFSVLGLHRLELAHALPNTASCRVAMKAGFTLEGTRRSALRHSDGWHDMHLHGRLADD